MPEIRVKANVRDAQKPVRKAIEGGFYDSLIVACKQGIAKTTPAVMKISLEFQITQRSHDQDATYKGRRVFQDYLIEPLPADPERTARETWRLKQVLDACSVPYKTEDGSTIFNTDHIVGKAVKIEVKTYTPNPTEEDMKLPVEQRPKIEDRNRVEKVDALSVNEENIL